MTKVIITQSYRHGCDECEEHATRITRWAAHDPQVTSVTLRAVPDCEHAKPAVQQTGQQKLFTVERQPANPPPPPMPTKTSTGVGDSLHRTGYDEPMP